jgi:hypothetical protein
MALRLDPQLAMLVRLLFCHYWSVTLYKDAQTKLFVGYLLSYNPMTLREKDRRQTGLATEISSTGNDKMARLEATVEGMNADGP